VQEQVTLRNETVEVERRPVSGGYREGTLSGDPFQERSIEVEERGEEAVVSKQARVKEELVVRKDVEQRTETVSDTVRKTEVDVEDDRSVPDTGTKGSRNRKI
jgi:stress response protein YsnF